MVLVFTLVVSVLTGVLFGMAPLLHLREHVVNSVVEGIRAAHDGAAARARVRGGLVMAEVALAVVLVIGAGLLLRSFWNLMTVDAGFNRSRLVTFGLVLPNATYQTPQSVVDFFARLTGAAGRAARRAGRRGDDGPAAAAPGERERHRLRGLHARRPTARSRTSTTTRP